VKVRSPSGDCSRADPYRGPRRNCDGILIGEEHGEPVIFRQIETPWRAARISTIVVTKEMYCSIISTCSRRYASDPAIAE